MVFSNIKSRQQERGFTIVELLIVIVVIGILAGITIVAYSGIRLRADQSRIQQNARSVQSVAEAFNADRGFYPALAVGALNSFSVGSASTRLPSGVTVIPDAAVSTITSASGTSTAAYSCLITCATSTGGRIAYWDPVTLAVVYVYVGSAAAASVYVYPAT